jgi:hypothetical protein
MAPWNAGKIPKGTSFGKKKTKKSKKQTGSTPPTVEPTIKKKKKGSETGQAKKNVAETGHKKSKERVKAQVDKLKKKKPKWVGWGIAIPKAEVVQTANEMKQLKKTIEEQALCIINQKESIEALKTQVKASGTESRTELDAANEIIETQKKLIQTLQKKVTNHPKAAAPSFKKKQTQPTANKNKQTQPTANKNPKQTQPTANKNTKKTDEKTQPSKKLPTLTMPTKTPPPTPEWPGFGEGEHKNVDMVIRLNTELWPTIVLSEPIHSNKAKSNLTDGKAGTTPKSGDPKNTFSAKDVGQRFVVSLPKRKFLQTLTLHKLETYKGILGGAGWLYKKGPLQQWCILPLFCRPVPQPKKKKSVPAPNQVPAPKKKKKSKAIK